MSALTVRSKAREQVIDITEDVAALAASMSDGVCSLFIQHTTCALTVLTNEEGIAEDLLSVLHGLVPQTTAYVHDSADHVRAHVLSALVGPSVSVPVRDGRLGLGQRSEEHTSELQSRFDLVCRLLLEKKKVHNQISIRPRHTLPAPAGGPGSAGHDADGKRPAQLAREIRTRQMARPVPCPGGPGASARLAAHGMRGTLTRCARRLPAARRVGLRVDAGMSEMSPAAWPRATRRRCVAA